MHEKTFRNYLVQLNKNKLKELAFLRPLSVDVFFAKIWKRKPTFKNSKKFLSHPYYSIYLIRKEQVYVGGVYVMDDDLHWYVLPAYRNKGILRNPLKTIIIPHLSIYKNRIVGSINKNGLAENDFIASTKLAKAVGFEQVLKQEGTYYYQIKLDSDFPVISGINSRITEENFERIKQALNYHSLAILMLKTEMEAHLGESDITEDAQEIVEDIQSLKRCVEDYYYIQS